MEERDQIVRKRGWLGKLVEVVKRAKDGDTIIVENKVRMELGKIAANRVRRDLIFVVGEENQ